jgi:hypothetical protein
MCTDQLDMHFLSCSGQVREAPVADAIVIGGLQYNVSNTALLYAEVLLQPAHWHGLVLQRCILH